MLERENNFTMQVYDTLNTDEDDFVNNFIGKNTAVKDLRIIKMDYYLDCVFNAFNMVIEYDLKTDKTHEVLKILYKDVRELKVNNHRAGFPGGFLHHAKLTGWENINYYVFDIDANGDCFDTVSFFCKSFEKTE